jgi:hypothetical protein
MALVFPSPPKPVLTPEETRALNTLKQREARDTKRLGQIDLTCPIFFADGRTPESTSEGPGSARKGRLSKNLARRFIARKDVAELRRQIGDILANELARCAAAVAASTPSQA